MYKNYPPHTHYCPCSGNVPGILIHLGENLLSRENWAKHGVCSEASLFGSNGSRDDCAYFGCISTVVNITRINIYFPCSKVIGTEKRPKFSNHSTVTVTSLNELNIPEWDVEQQTHK